MPQVQTPPNRNQAPFLPPMSSLFPAVPAHLPSCAHAHRYEHLDRRLDSLEATLLTLLHNVKSRVRNPAAGAGVGPAGQGDNVAGDRVHACGAQGCSAAAAGHMLLMLGRQGRI